jgi:tetratricopeptide (TPR) repeat protein
MMNIQKYAFLRNNTYSIISFSCLFFVICFLSNQHSYSQISDNSSIDIFIDTLVEKADQLIDEDRYDEAIQYYDKALKLNPNYVDVLNNKALVLSDLGRHEEAIQYLDKVLEIDPNNVDALDMKRSVSDELDI